MFNEENLQKYTQKKIDELNKQEKSKYCLVIIFDIVYNLYKFAYDHPGGERLIMNAAGEILDEVVGDENHRFTATQVSTRLAKYKFGLFDKGTVSAGSANAPLIGP